TSFEAITLERGVTHDVDFEQWANKVWNYGAGLGAEVSLRDFRKDLVIDFFNEAGQLARTTTHVDALVVSVLAEAQGVGGRRRAGP
ncbi:MAG TPA: phage tail protein, partial [Paracoccus sp. (in: a-proteobacteria)]|nr:phage tail protein [Paracoccus sp. (in: a-proteobacteria)]